MARKTGVPNPNKGKGELYDEVKQRINLTLTPTAKQKLDDMAWGRRLSMSELVEQIARGEYLLVPKSEAELLGKPVPLALSASGG